MFSPRTIVLDCGASRTALGVFTRQGRGIRMDEYAVETFTPALDNGDHWLEQTRRALRALRSRVQAAGPVVVVVPAHLVLTKFLKIPRVAPAKRGKILRFEAGQSIPYALADVVWGSVVVGEGGSDLEMLLAAARLDTIEPLCAAAQAAGFEPRFVQPSLLATLAGFRLVHSTQTQSSLVLNVGARSTTLLLVEAQRFAARILALGGNSITRPIATNQGCASGEAEAIKQADQDARVSVDAMETLATRLAQEITRSVLHFRRQNEMASPVRIYLTGGCARLAGLAEALTVKLQVPVGWFDVLGAIETKDGSVQSAANEHALTLADLIGAAAIQLRPGQPGLDLLPPRRRWQENLRRRQPWMIAAALLVVVAMITPVVHLRNLASAAQRRTAALESELAPLREREARNRANLRQIEELRRQVIQLQDVYDRRASWLNQLSGLQDRLGRVEDVWLEKMQVMPAPAGAPVKLLISGRMLDKTYPLSKASPELFRRVKTLLASIGDSPFGATIESEHFNNHHPGILHFDFVLVVDPRHPL